MEFNMVSSCANCGEIIPGTLECFPLCDHCRMRLDQLTENLAREFRVFGEGRKKVREGLEKK